MLLRFIVSETDNIKSINLQLLNRESTWSEEIILPQETTDIVELKIPIDKLKTIAQTTPDSILDIESCIYNDAGGEYCTSFKFTFTDYNTKEAILITSGWYVINFNI